MIKFHINRIIGYQSEEILIPKEAKRRAKKRITILRCCFGTNLNQKKET